MSTAFNGPEKEMYVVYEACFLHRKHGEECWCTTKRTQQKSQTWLCLGPGSEYLNVCEIDTLYSFIYLFIYLILFYLGTV